LQENQQNIDLLEVICWIETLTLAGDGGGSTRHNEEAKSRRNYPVYVFIIFLDHDASLVMTEGGRDASFAMAGATNQPIFRLSLFLQRW
jgi:hypothetical protein